MSSFPRPASQPPTVSEFLRVLRRRWAVVVAGALIGLAAGIFVLPSLQDEPLAVASVRVDVQSLPPSVEPPAQQAAGSRGRTAVDPSPRIRDAAAMEATLVELGSDAARLTAVQGRPESSWAGAALPFLSAAPVTGTSHLRLAYADRDPALAERVATTYAEQFAEGRNSFYTAAQTRLVDRATDQAQALLDEVLALSAKADAERVSAGATSVTTQVQLELARNRYEAKVGQRESLATTLETKPTPTRVIGDVAVSAASGAADTFLYGLIGLLLGLTLAIGLALVLHALRDPVTRADELTDRTGVTVLAAVPTRGRARSGVTVVQRPAGAAANGLQRARVALHMQGLCRHGDVVAFVSPGSGDGRSTVVVNIAEAMAAEGRDVVLVCGDARNPQLDRHYGLQGAAGLVNAVVGAADPLDLLVQVSPGLSVLPAGTGPRGGMELLRLEQVRRVLDELRSKGAVLVDTPPAATSAEAMALAVAADATVVVARSGHTRREALGDLCARLEHVQSRTAGIILLGRSHGISRRPASVVAAAPPVGAERRGEAAASPSPASRRRSSSSSRLTAGRPPRRAGGAI